MIESIVKFRAKSQLCVFVEAPNRGGLPDGDIGVELSGTGDDALTCIAVTRRAIGADGRNVTNRRVIKPASQMRAGAAWSQEVVIGGARANRDGGRSGKAINRAAFFVSESHRRSTLHDDDSRNRPATRRGADEIISPHAGYIVTEVGNHTVPAIEARGGPVQGKISLVVVNRGVGFSLGEGVSELKTEAARDLLPQCGLRALVPRGSEILVRQQSCGRVADDGDAQSGVE